MQTLKRVYNTYKSSTIWHFIVWLNGLNFLRSRYYFYWIHYLKICRDKISLRSEASLNSFVMRMIYFDSHFWFLSCRCCCILHPCNFAQLAVLNINQSHMFMSFCQTTTANSSIIPLGNQHVPSISISLLHQGFRGQSHSFMKLRGNC